MKAMAVLAHHMSAKTELGVESRARAELAIKSIVTNDVELVLTSGWAYRKDCDVAIGQVMADYIDAALTATMPLAPYNRTVNVVADTLARDTVGDAFFLRRRLKGLGVLPQLESISVITSDYHMTRTTEIFSQFFDHLCLVQVLGAQTSKYNSSDVQAYESTSLTAFKQTFASVDMQNDEAVWQALCQKHPFYNGSIHPRL